MFGGLDEDVCVKIHLNSPNSREHTARALHCIESVQPLTAPLGTNLALLSGFVVHWETINRQAHGIAQAATTSSSTKGISSPEVLFNCKVSNIQCYYCIYVLCQQVRSAIALAPCVWDSSSQVISASSTSRLRALKRPSGPPKRGAPSQPCLTLLMQLATAREQVQSDPWDEQAWQVVSQELQRQQPDPAALAEQRVLFEELLTQFPTAVRYSVLLKYMHQEGVAFVRFTKSTRCLSLHPNVQCNILMYASA
jgi:hypothetical protein